MGSDTACHAVRLRPGLFQSTLPGWGATYGHPHGDAHQIISIHAPRMGSDHHRNIGRFALRQFQSTLPGWGATVNCRVPGVLARFQSTLPGWGATDKEAGTRLARQISIHAPRMGSDLRWRRRCVPRSHFNPRSPDGERLERKGRQLHATTISIHAPRMGSDQETIPIGLETQFQSTLPGWGATGCSRCHHRRTVYFNPRSPDGERRSIRASARPTIHFNPRSPDGERLSNVYDLVNRLRFQSTLPGWGATRLPDAIRGTPKRFQSTLPGWGATFVEFSRAGSVGFQSTLPGWGATCRSACSPCLSRHFNPRSPDGERPGPKATPAPPARFQSTLPGWGATPRTPLQYANLALFQSTLPGWGATLAS